METATATPPAEPPRRTLYELTGDALALSDLLETTEGEVTEEIDQWMTEHAAALCRKSDGIGFYIKEQEAVAKACKEEAARLTARAKSSENRIAGMKRVVDHAMVALGVEKLVGTIFTIARQKSGGVPKLTLLVPTDVLPAEYVDVTTPAPVVTPNQDRLRAWLATEGGGVVVREGVEIRVARLEDPTYTIRIR
jgi:hypothetical protein